MGPVQSQTETSLFRRQIKKVSFGTTFTFNFKLGFSKNKCSNKSNVHVFVIPWASGHGLNTTEKK